MPESFYHIARACVGHPRHQISMTGVGTYDSWDRLQKVLSVDTLELSRNYAISAQFDEISQLKHGWFDGAGIAPDPVKLTLISEKFIAEYPDKMALPRITPTQDGNILLEWSADGDPSLDIHLVTLRANFHAFGANGEDIEREFHLENWTDWSALLTFLGETVRGHTP
jgi:hypothetical protein